MRPKKYLGQHWLNDTDTLDSIVKAAQLNDGDVVLEIGPGLGSLTQLLDAVAQVIAVEKDGDLLKGLQKMNLARTEFVHADILEFDLQKLPPGYKVVANIPYYITSALFKLFLESQNRPDLLVLLVQKEVAARVVASAGDMSVLSFSVQYYADASVDRLVPKELFTPPPKVDSAILVIKPLNKPRFEATKSELFRLVKAGFGERRKQLKNSLAGGLHASSTLIETALAQADLSPHARAQELSLSQWEKLYRIAVSMNLLS